MIRVLIADDHGVVRDGLGRLVEALPDMELVGLAADGEEAVERSRDSEPDVVLMDLDMPRLDGIETCRRLKSEPSTADATIVMLTGDSDQDAELEARRAGADLFLTKPFSPLHLLRLVDRLADLPPQPG